MPPLETLTPPPAQPPTIAEKIARHPYLGVAIVVLVLLAIGLVVVMQRSGVSATRGGVTWEGAGGVFFTGGRNINMPRQVLPEDVIKQASPNTHLGYIPIPMTINGTEGTNPADEFASLLAQLTQPSGGTTPAPTEPDFSAYSFIPTGLISINAPVKEETATQAALRTFGNEVGTYVQGFESLHSNSALMLKDQAEDRTNPDKAAGLDRLGNAYAELGRDLTNMQEVPDAAKSALSAYAISLRIVGTNMTKIAKASTDEEYLDAIGKYNESVEGLAKRFIALVNLFVMNDVQFSSSEPGSVFMFNGSASTSL